LPLLRALRWIGRVVGRKEAGREGRRAVLAVLAAGAVLVFAVPLPHRTQHDGVLWLPERALLRATQSGFVEQLLAEPGQGVASGDAVAVLRDPALASVLQVQAAREQAALARLEAARVLEPARAQQLELEWSREAGALAHHRARAERLLLRAGAAGALWLPDAVDLPGRWLKEGQLLGYVLADEAPRVHLIVDQADADLLREAANGPVEVRLPADPGRGWTAQVTRIVPAASTELPSPALGRQGGGAVPTDPRDDSGRRALVSHFEVELALPAEFPHRVVGARVGVRFEHRATPLAPRVWRAARRLFLTHFRT
jgi:putative peptide zinc metalloprotease protein